MLVRKIVFSLLILILLFTGFLLIENNFTYSSIFNSTYTKAFCSENTCRDFVVSCSGDEVVELVPISGFAIFGDGWVDEREDKDLC